MKKKLSRTATIQPTRQATRVRAAQFPSILRTFPEAVPLLSAQGTRLFLINFVCGFTLMGIVVLGMQLRESYQALQLSETTRRNHVAEMKYWTNVVTDRPQYRDAYYKLATMHLMLGERKSALAHIEKALVIDPWFSAGYSLKQEIQGLL